MSRVSKERVSALSDGMIAIAATLLVLELKVPDDGALSAEIVMHWARTLAGWMISFAMIALIWFENHFQMASASRWTVGLTVATFVQLALLSLIPFGSNLIVDTPDSLFAALVFNGILLANGLCLAGTMWMIGRNKDIHISAAVSRVMEKRANFALLSYLLTAFLGVFSAIYHHPFTGIVLWALIPFIVSLRALGLLDLSEDKGEKL